MVDVEDVYTIPEEVIGYQSDGLTSGGKSFDFLVVRAHRESTVRY